MNKKGNIGSVIFLAFAFFVVLILGIGAAFVVLVVDWTADEVFPELTSEDLGTYDDVNLTNVSKIALDPVNTFVQSFTWLVAVGYMLVLIAMFGLAFAFRFFGNKWLAALYLLFMFILIIASIWVSNIYEDFYNDDNEVGTRLEEQVLMSWLILYSPIIFTVIGFVCGIIMFSGGPEEVFI